MVKEITKQLTLLKDYYSSNVKNEILILWAKDLMEHYKFEDITIAIKSYRFNETYPPTLAGIIKYIPEKNIDYAQLILETVRKYDSNNENGRKFLKEDPVALNLYNKYGSQVGMSEPYSTSQKFLFKNINEEAEAQLKYNKQIINYIEKGMTLKELKDKSQEYLQEQKLLGRGIEWKKKK